jgi:chromosome segregation ATPase
MSSNASEDTRPQYFTSQGLDMKLRDACAAIEIARKKLFDDQTAITAYDKMLKKERELRLQCSNAYKELYEQHEKTLTDVNNIASKCLSLHRELEEAQGIIHAYKMTIGQHEQRLSSRATPSDVKDHATDQGDWDMVEPAIEQLQARIRDLEGEKETMKREHQNALINLEAEQSTMMQRHESALINAADRIGAADRKLAELAKERADMIEEHQNALANATDRMVAAEQKAQEYELMYLTSTAAAPDLISSPGAGKRQRSEDEQDLSTPQQVGPLQKTRRRRTGAKAKGEKIVG